MNDGKTNTAHHTTVELANAKLSLRRELSFHLQEYQDEPCYLIEDELNSRYFRIGLPEYHFISLLDGSTSVAQAVAQTASKLGDQAISESDALTICKWLLDSNLASTEASRTCNRLIESHESTARRQTFQKLNPVTPKFPLFNPNRLLGVIHSSVGWLFSFPLFMVWLAVVASAAYHVTANWSSATQHASTVFSADNWIWLALTWLGLKLIHEIAHGVVCKRFGGNVRQAGLVLIVLLPLPYVDVTSSWRFLSKWHRIFVAAAGMYAEIFVAAVAALIWSQVEPGVIKQQCYNIMIAGSITTFVFNANPLMRFDGYYMLTDWLEMPNLGTHGQQLLRWAGKRFYLGLNVKKPTWPEQRSGLIASYAVLAFIWRILICVGLILAAEAMFFGAGIVLALLAGFLWVVWPIGKLLRFVLIGNETEQKPSTIRFCLLTGTLVALGWSVFNYLPWYARVQAPAIVDYATRSEVRTPVGGFVDQIFVKPDQAVKRGALIATLRNRELLADIEMLQMQIRTAELKARIYQQRPRNIPAYQVEIKNREALHKRLHERLQQQAKLEIRAPMDGQIMADELDSLLETYLSPGHKLCSIGSYETKKVQALIAQEDFELFQSKTGERVDIHIWGQGLGYFPATLVQVNPRARVALPHPAFSSTTGGPLPVKYRAPATAGNAVQEDEEQPFELVDPRFVAQISLNSSKANQLFPGQLGTVSFRGSRGTIGEVLYEKVARWLSQARKQSQQSWH